MPHVRVVLSAVAVMVALAWIATELTPRRYAAVARVLEAGTMVKFEDTSTDPSAALAAVNSALREHRGERSVVIDHAMVFPLRRNTGINLALGAAAGLGLGLGLVAWRSRRRGPRVRSERDLIGALGEPLLAARPMSNAAVRALARQLLAHWFAPGQRALLPVVSAHAGEGRSWLAAALAAAFAELGEKTLLIDADLRRPGQHRLFGVPNRRGLAEFLQRDRKFTPLVPHPNLSLILAGNAAEDPLELLGRRRLRELLEASARKFPVIIVDTPAAERGPDLEMFAALAGGALVVARRHSADSGALAELQSRLARCSARVVATVLNAPA